MFHQITTLALFDGISQHFDFWRNFDPVLSFLLKISIFPKLFV